MASRPKVGFIPKMPQAAAGILMEPPPSLPAGNHTQLCAEATDWMPGATKEHLLLLPAAGATVSGWPCALQGSEAICKEAAGAPGS